VMSTSVSPLASMLATVARDVLRDRQAGTIR
jgi:hypothetical protein